jgi:hypothetical protein
MTTLYYDALALSTSGACLNCGALVSHLIHGHRCRLCQEYRVKHHRERPTRAWKPEPPVWGIFRPEEAGPDDERYCDCGKLATQTLTVPACQRGKMTLILCDDCAALERRLAPVHSWAGG